MKRLIGKLIGLLVVVLLLQSIFGHGDIHFPEYRELNRMLREGTDILYLGDCTDHTLAHTDLDKRPISQILREGAQGQNVQTLTHMAYHAGIFLEYARYLVKQPKPPKVVIMPINMRSFSPQWDYMPHYQFEIHKIILRGGLGKRLLYAFYNPLRVFRYDFYSISREEYMAAPVYDGEQRVGTVADLTSLGRIKNSAENMLKKFILSYMYLLKPDHRKVLALLDLAQLLTARGIRVIFYLTPIDVQSGEKYLPNRFARRLKENTALIRQLLADKDVTLLDLSIGVGVEGFSWKDRIYPSEQLSETGRRYVAEELLRVLNRK